jgi:non-ribosomal peptide synthetase component F
VVLRVIVRPSLTFSQLVGQVRQACIEAYAHQDLPFEHLETLVAQNKRQGPLYQVMLNYRNQSTPPLAANGLTIASWDGKHRARDPGIAMSRADLNFHLRELSTHLAGAVTYKTDLFDDAAIATLLEQFQTILEQLAAERHARVADLAVCGDSI